MHAARAASLTLLLLCLVLRGVEPTTQLHDVWTVVHEQAAKLTQLEAGLAEADSKNQLQETMLAIIQTDQLNYATKTDAAIAALKQTVQDQQNKITQLEADLLRQDAASRDLTGNITDVKITQSQNVNYIYQLGTLTSNLRGNITNQQASLSDLLHNRLLQNATNHDLKDRIDTQESSIAVLAGELFKQKSTIGQLQNGTSFSSTFSSNSSSDQQQLQQTAVMELHNRLSQQESTLAMGMSSIDQLKVSVANHSQMLSDQESLQLQLNTSVHDQQQELSALDTRMRAQEQVVYFRAKLDGDHDVTLTPKESLKFNVVIVDTHKGYNAHNGKFTAPVPGLYAFYVHVRAGGSADKHVKLGLYTTSSDNGANAASGRLLSLDTMDTGSQGQTSTSVYVRLAQGDQVCVQFISGDSHLNQHYGYFFGTLVTPE